MGFHVVKNVALTSMVILICVIATKVFIFSSSSEESNEHRFFSAKYLANESWLSTFGDASKYTRLFVFSRNNSERNYTEIIFKNMSTIINSGLDLKTATKILVHGWLDNAFVNFAQELRDAYLETQDVNVMAVDWSPRSSLVYPLTRTAVEPVGVFLARCIDWLVSEAGVSVGSVHIIGHSLGAHIAGVAGEHVTAGQIGRITGLDPAGPGFGSSKKGRLDSSDAEFVDVIHTAGLWAGYYNACGHADFYPNKGVPNQPGCPLDFGKCSHIRSYQLFAESVSSQLFVSKSCKNWKNYVKGRCQNNSETIMGEHVDLRARGNFYLQTTGKPPYAIGNDYFLQRKNLKM